MPRLPPSLLLTSTRRLALPSSYAATAAPPRALTTTLVTARPFTSTPASRTPDKDKKASLQDREAMNTEPAEYAKSGTDSQSAAQDEAAYDGTGKNSPEEAKDKAGQGNENNPLDVSPANMDVSQPTSEEASGGGKKAS